jgi:hypothetical protein
MPLKKNIYKAIGIINKIGNNKIVRSNKFVALEAIHYHFTKYIK